MIKGPSFLACHAKGNLISERFSLWFQSQKIVPNHSPEDLLFIAMGSALAPVFGDLSQGEKDSEIKPPVAWHANKTISKKVFIFQRILNLVT